MLLSSAVVPILPTIHMCMDGTAVSPHIKCGNDDGNQDINI